MTKIDTSTLPKLQQKIQVAETNSGREVGSSLLIGASKTQNDVIIRAFYHEGLQHFGENYLNEAVEKINTLSDLMITWHYIGGIQSNKTKAIAENFDWVHTVDRLKIGQRLNKHFGNYCKNAGSNRKLNVLLQVNLDDEPRKNGVAPENAEVLADELSKLEHLQLRGLMSIPKARDSYQEQVDCHKRLASLQEQLNQKLGLNLDTLSAGMSQDLEAAIAAGSTMIRIGTDLFGKRK